MCVYVLDYPVLVHNDLYLTARALFVYMVCVGVYPLSPILRILTFSPETKAATSLAFVVVDRATTATTTTTAIRYCCCRRQQHHSSGICRWYFRKYQTICATFFSRNVIILVIELCHLKHGDAFLNVGATRGWGRHGTSCQSGSDFFVNLSVVAVFLGSHDDGE